MHLSRKLFHSTGIVIVLLYRGLDIPQRTAALLLWICVGLLALLDFLRARWPALQQLFLTSVKWIVDKKDERGFNSSTLYFAGCATAVTLFPPDHACAGILALALGDAMAAIVGSSVKSPRWGNVSLAGTLACVVATAAGVVFFFPLWMAALAGVLAAVLEAVSGSKLDNLTMPIGVAALLYVL